MSPEEELRIRRLLTLYLGSLITFADDEPSHFQLCHPDTALEAREIPKEVLGLRRQYLKEIQANIKARQNYQDLLAAKKGESRIVTIAGEDDAGARRLKTHLKLLQMRRRHKEVQITRQYLEELKETNPAKDGGLEFRSAQSHDGEVPQFSLCGGVDGADSRGESTKALMERLERAVIRAKYQLERERELLAEVKDRHTRDNSEDQAIDPRARLAALSATRDELVRFLEEKMSTASLDNDVPTYATKQDDELASDRQQVQEQINAEYERYIMARKSVLEAAAKALYISSGPCSETPVAERGIQAVAERVPPQRPATSKPAISILPFMTEQLLPLLHYQKATALQKSYMAKVAATERAKALESLERLGDESHLIPAYPIMARQERFKNAAAALGGPRKLDQAMSGTGESNEIIERAEAWAFAAEEATKAEEEFVMDKVRFANKRLDSTEQSLAALNKLLGGDPDSELVVDVGGETDIWVEAAGEATQKVKTRKLRPGPQDRGPWVGLNGRVGVVEGKKS